MKPNWPLIGIIAGAVITVAIVVLIFVSTASTGGRLALPTTVALSKVPTTTTEKSLTITFSSNKCVFATVDGVTSFAIWPKNFRRDSTGDVVAPDGSTYADGEKITASAVVTNRAAVVALDGGGDNGYLGSFMTSCQGSATPAVIITAVDR